jgi:hypothetical protein
VISYRHFTGKQPTHLEVRTFCSSPLEQVSEHSVPGFTGLASLATSCSHCRPMVGPWLICLPSGPRSVHAEFLPRTEKIIHQHLSALHATTDVTTLTVVVCTGRADVDITTSEREAKACC